MKKKLKQFWNDCTKPQKYFLLFSGWFIGAGLYIAINGPLDVIFLCWGAFCSYGIVRVMNGGW